MTFNTRNYVICQHREAKGREYELCEKRKDSHKGALFPQVSFFFLLILHLSWVGGVEFGSSYLGKATAAARAARPIPNSACSILVFPKQ